MIRNYYAMIGRTVRHFKGGLYVCIGISSPMQDIDLCAAETNAFGYVCSETKKQRMLVIQAGRMYHWDKIHCENKMMIYQSLQDGTIYARDLDMFVSKTDKVKYPDAKQTYIFEVIK